MLQCATTDLQSYNFTKVTVLLQSYKGYAGLHLEIFPIVPKSPKLRSYRSYKGYAGLLLVIFLYVPKVTRLQKLRRLHRASAEDFP